MSAVAEVSAASATASGARAVGDRGRFTDLVAAEWIKYRSLPSSFAVLALMAFVACAGVGIGEMHLTLSPYGISVFDPLAQAFNAGAWNTLMACAGCVGAMSLTGEHGSGLIRTTLIAVPDRRRLVAAKIALTAGVMAVVGAALAVASIVVSQVMMDPAYRVHSVVSGAAAVNVAACGTTLAVSAVVGMAIAAVLRNIVATLLAVGILITMLPNYLRPSGGWLSVAAKSLPRHAWEGLAVHVDAAQDSGGYVPRAAGAWAGCAVWLAIGVIVTTLVVQRRDV